MTRSYRFAFFVSTSVLSALQLGCSARAEKDASEALVTPTVADSSTLWVERDGIVKVELERYAPRPKWSVQHAPEGYSGSGYLKWMGEFQHGETEGFHPAELPLGSRDEWITVNFRIDTPGYYRADIRNFHVHEDGDNDVWLRFPETDAGWHKVGSQQENDYAFLYWTYGENPTLLNAGVHTAYITGRSHGFGLDYLVIYRGTADTPSLRMTAADSVRVVNAPESQAVAR